MKNTDEALGKLITKGIEVAEQTGKFVIDNAPELIQQFYTWHIAQNIFGIVVGIAFLLGAYKVVKSFGKEEKDWDTDAKVFGKHIGIVVIITSLMLTLFGEFFFLCSLYELIYIICAPKLYLIEYFIK